MYWLIRRKARVQTPARYIETKYEKYFFGDFFSADFWPKLWQQIKLPRKIPQKICHSVSTLNCRSPRLIYKINTHNIGGVRNYGNNPDWRIAMTNYVCYGHTHVLCIIDPGDLNVCRKQMPSGVQCRVML